MNPVYRKEDKWYFWDEAQCHSYGPFDSMPEALDSLMKYNKELKRYYERLSNNEKEI